jgi:outer membrane receptor protein involved in Fe transport
MRRYIVLFAFVIATFISAAAQSQSTTGNIEGRVVDPNGAVVPNVTVTATNTSTGLRKSVQSDGEGNYIFVLLPPGTYRVETAATQGFGAAKYENVVVTVGAKNSLEITLAAGSSVNVVEVTAGAGVEVTRTSVSSTVGEEQVINLPTNGRNFLDFATITPGVVRDPTRSGDLAIGGQKGTLNSVQIDGASSDNTFFGQSSGRIGSGRAPSQFSIDTVKEFQVNQNGFSAEFGRAAGGVLNVVTKSGTNHFTGSAFEYFRDESLNALNPNLRAAARPRPPGQINQFGGTIGGRFVKDKAFFFGAYEGQRSDLSNPVVVNSLAQAPPAVRTFLAPKFVAYSQNRQQDTYLIKTDFNINARNQLWVRFNQQDFTGTNLEFSGLTNSFEHSGNSNVQTTTITTGWNATLRSNWFNEFRFQFGRDKEPGLANSSDPEVVLASGTPISETLNFGRNNFSPRETTIKRWQFINNQTFVKGNHAVKYGLDLMFDNIFNFFPGFFSGGYNFTSYTNFANNVPSRYRQSFAGPGTTGAVTHPDNREYGFFVQDDWKVSPSLTVNPGLRYDYQSIAKPQVQNPNAALLAAGYDTSFGPKDKNNFAPRIGMSYAFDDRSVLRGGYGIYYGRTPAIMTGTAHSQNGIQVVAIDINCTSTPALCPVYPAVFASIPTNVAAVTPNLYVFDRKYRQPFTHQGRIQYERQLTSNLFFAARYTVYRGDDISRTRNVNLNPAVAQSVFVWTPNPGSTQTSETLTVMRHPTARPNSSFQRISVFESSAKSLYQGMTLELNRRLANKWSFTTSYTLSKAKDNKPDQTSVVVGGGDDGKIAEDQLGLTGEYARSDLDMRHRFIFSPVYDTGRFESDNAFARALLSDYVITGIFTAQSGFAYSAGVTGDPNGDGNTANDRAPGTRRNQFSTPASWIVDLRIGRAIRFGERAKVTFFAEGFNLFNRPNVQSVNRNLYAYSVVAGVPRLTRTTNFQTPSGFVSGSPSFTFNSSYNREFQLGVRLDF